MMLQAALNGARRSGEHSALPVTAEELARDAAACARAGAGAMHLHPRGPDGRETLDPAVVDAVVEAVRASCRVPVGVSTGAWIEPDLERRLELIRAWRAPDFASVNLSEPGAAQVLEALIEAGVGIEAGLASPEDVDRLIASGLAGEVTRVLVEAPALDAAAGIHLALDRCGLAAPRLQHGEGETAWALIEDALRRRIDTRVGLEDTLICPHGRRTAGNESLVLAVARLAHG
jgi:uncharacterized protein (DUF849 family)